MGGVSPRGARGGRAWTSSRVAWWRWTSCGPGRPSRVACGSSSTAACCADDALERISCRRRSCPNTAGAEPADALELLSGPLRRRVGAALGAATASTWRTGARSDAGQAPGRCVVRRLRARPAVPAGGRWPSRSRWPHATPSARRGAAWMMRAAPTTRPAEHGDDRGRRGVDAFGLVPPAKVESEARPVSVVVSTVVVMSANAEAANSGIARSHAEGEERDDREARPARSDPRRRHTGGDERGHDR